MDLAHLMDSQMPNNPATPPVEPTVAYPPRYWWLKRGAVLVVTAIIALIGLRLWWGHVADRELQEMANAAHARGEPFWPEDFDPAPVPDANNAGLSLSKAAAAIVMNTQYNTVNDSNSSDLPTPALLQTIGAVLTTNRSSLQLARQARSQTQIDWGIRARTPVLTTYLPSRLLTGQRHLANLLSWAALHAHATGNDLEAIEYLRDILRQAEALAHATPTLVSDMVVTGIVKLAADRVHDLAWDLSLEGESSPAKSPATRKQVRDLIAELLNEESFRQGAVLSWEGERMMNLDAVHHVRGGFVDPVLQFWFVKPMFDLDGVRLARSDEGRARATTQPNWPAAKKQIASASNDDTSSIARLTQLISTVMEPSTERAILLQFRALTERRVAAIELAIRLYRVDHHGNYPASLNELTPRYLPAVPLDPMAVGATPMRYRPEAKPPVVYSVGEDGKDDGGTSLPNDGPKGDRWQQSDAVYPLEPLPAPATRPSPETQDND
jgi:hypothetical protein